MRTEEKKKAETLETDELIKSFNAGNFESFDKLVTMYSPRLYNTAYGLLKSKQDVEEVVQDAFIRAFKALNNFRGDASFETWMHRITINLARNKYHWNRRRGGNETINIPDMTDECQEQLDYLYPDNRMRPDLIIENSELESEIMNGFADLPESLRKTMELRHISNLQYEEIAAQLSCKVGTVKSRLARGRELLRKYFISRDFSVTEIRRDI
jgi:RNA polymerase sigma-70 factor (ECF subfamily)